MIEGPYVEEWIYGLLSKDPYLVASVVHGRVFRGSIAQDPDDSQGRLLPAIRFFETGSMDKYVLGAYRVQNTLFYQIEVIDQASSISHLRPVADRFDYLLHGNMAQTLSIRVMSCVRDSELNYVRIDESLEYQHLGGLYRIQAQALSVQMLHAGA